MYSGSHNFTIDSWGTIETKNGITSNICHNYELGVFFPPSTPSNILNNLHLPFGGVNQLIVLFPSFSLYLLLLIILTGGAIQSR